MMIATKKSFWLLGFLGFVVAIFLLFEFVEVMSFKVVQGSPQPVETRELQELKLTIERQQKEIQLLNASLNAENKEVQVLKAKLNSQPILDLEDLPNLVGPRKGDLNTATSLVVICIGKTDKTGVNNLMVNFFNKTELYSFMFFHYDASTWDEFDWYNKLNVVSIRVTHKMKYWYIKRFITPNLARAFSHIILLDADVDFEQPFDPQAYLKVADSYNLGLSQPSHFKATSSLHPAIKNHDGEQMGRYTEFVECGPATFLSSAAYQCVYDLIQPDLTSGWGLDVKWADYVKNTCGFGNTSVAVLDAFVLIHKTVSSQGTASSNPGFNYNALYELEAYKTRFPDVKDGWGVQPEFPFGFRSCAYTEHPASSTNCT